MRRIGLTLVLLMMTCIANAQIGREDMSASVRLLSIGEAFIQAGNYEKATQIYEDAGEAARGVEEKWNATDKLATLYSVGGSPKEALACYNVLLSDSAVLINELYQMYIHGGIGRVYMLASEYVRAIKSFEKAVQLSKYKRDEGFMSDLYSNMAHTLLVAGDVSRAEALLDSAETIGLRKGDNEALVNVYNVRADMYRKYGDYENAYTCLKKHVEYYNKIRESEIANLVSKSNPLYVQDKVESTMKLQKRVEELEEQLAERDTTMNIYAQIKYVCILLVLFFLSMTIWMYFMGRRSRKRVKTLESTLDEKRRVMAIVAHDFVNPFNSLIGFAELQLQYAMVHEDKELIKYYEQMRNISNYREAAIALCVALLVVLFIVASVMYMRRVVIEKMNTNMLLHVNARLLRLARGGRESLDNLAANLSREIYDGTHEYLRVRNVVVMLDYDDTVQLASFPNGVDERTGVFLQRLCESHNSYISPDCAIIVFPLVAVSSGNEHCIGAMQIEVERKLTTSETSTLELMVSYASSAAYYSIACLAETYRSYDDVEEEFLK